MHGPNRAHPAALEAAAMLPPPTGALVLWSGMTAFSGFAGKFWYLFAARLGVGEDACTPCAQSIICDLYPPGKRATALSTYAVGVPLGILIGGMGGALAAEMVGWRGAFVIAAIPGLLLTLILYLTVPEPRRGGCEPTAYVDGDTPSFFDVVRTLWRSPSFRHTAMDMRPPASRARRFRSSSSPSWCACMAWSSFMPDSPMA